MKQCTKCWYFLDDQGRHHITEMGLPLKFSPKVLIIPSCPMDYVLKPFSTFDAMVADMVTQMLKDAVLDMGDSIKEKNEKILFLI